MMDRIRRGGIKRVKLENTWGPQDKDHVQEQERGDTARASEAESLPQPARKRAMIAYEPNAGDDQEGGEILETTGSDSSGYFGCWKYWKYC